MSLLKAPVIETLISFCKEPNNERERYDVYNFLEKIDDISTIGSRPQETQNIIENLFALEDSVNIKLDISNLNKDIGGKLKLDRGIPPNLIITYLAPDDTGKKTIEKNITFDSTSLRNCPRTSIGITKQGKGFTLNGVETSKLSGIKCAGKVGNKTKVQLGEGATVALEKGDKFYKEKNYYIIERAGKKILLKNLNDKKTKLEINSGSEGFYLSGDLGKETQLGIESHDPLLEPVFVDAEGKNLHIWSGELSDGRKQVFIEGQEDSTLEVLKRKPYNKKDKKDKSDGIEFSLTYPLEKRTEDALKAGIPPVDFAIRPADQIRNTKTILPIHIEDTSIEGTYKIIKIGDADKNKNGVYGLRYTASVQGQQPRLVEHISNSIAWSFSKDSGITTGYTTYCYDGYAENVLQTKDNGAVTIAKTRGESTDWSTYVTRFKQGFDKITDSQTKRKDKLDSGQYNKSVILSGIQMKERGTYFVLQEGQDIADEEVGLTSTDLNRPNDKGDYEKVPVIIQKFASDGQVTRTIAPDDTSATIRINNGRLTKEKNKAYESIKDYLGTKTEIYAGLTSISVNENQEATAQNIAPQMVTAFVNSKTKDDEIQGWKCLDENCTKWRKNEKTLSSSELKQRLKYDYQTVQEAKTWVEKLKDTKENFEEIIQAYTNAGLDPAEIPLLEKYILGISEVSQDDQEPKDDLIKTLVKHKGGKPLHLRLSPKIDSDNNQNEMPVKVVVGSNDELKYFKISGKDKGTEITDVQKLWTIQKSGRTTTTAPAEKIKDPEKNALLQAEAEPISINKEIAYGLPGSGETVIHKIAIEGQSKDNENNMFIKLRRKGNLLWVDIKKDGIWQSMDCSDWWTHKAKLNKDKKRIDCGDHGRLSFWADKEKGSIEIISVKNIDADTSYNPPTEIKTAGQDATIEVLDKNYEPSIIWVQDSGKPIKLAVTRTSDDSFNIGRYKDGKIRYFYARKIPLIEKEGEIFDQQTKMNVKYKVEKIGEEFIVKILDVRYSGLNKYEPNHEEMPSDASDVKKTVSNPKGNEQESNQPTTNAPAAETKNTMPNPQQNIEKSEISVTPNQYFDLPSIGRTTTVNFEKTASEKHTLRFINRGNTLGANIKVGNDWYILDCRPYGFGSAAILNKDKKIQCEGKATIYLDYSENLLRIDRVYS